MRDFVTKKAATKDSPPVPALPAEGRKRPKLCSSHPREAPQEPLEAPSVAPPSPGSYPHTIGLRIGHSLYTTAENALEGAHRAGDYTVTSIPELLRAALRAYLRGMPLTAAPETGGKKRTTIGLDDELKAGYDGLPRRKRGEIIERALRTFLNSGFKAE